MKLGTRGNGPLETIVTFPVLFGTFLTMIELAELELASLTTQHAAVEAARAATVILADDPRFYDEPVGAFRGRRKDEILEAARIPLAAAAKSPKVTVAIGGGPLLREGDDVEVRVTFELPCRVPVGKYLLCGLAAKRTFVREAKLPYQGAGYAYP